MPTMVFTGGDTTVLQGPLPAGGVPRQITLDEILASRLVCRTRQNSGAHETSQLLRTQADLAAALATGHVVSFGPVWSRGASCLVVRRGADVSWWQVCTPEEEVIDPSARSLPLDEATPEGVEARLRAAGWHFPWSTP